jgi:positive regulator of sigma E activity
MKKRVLFFIPPLLFLLVYSLSYVVEMLRMKSDTGVAVGFILFYAIIIGYYFITKLIIKKLKQTNEKSNSIS